MFLLHKVYSNKLASENTVCKENSMNLLLARFIRTKSITFIELYKTCPDSELKICARTYAYLYTIYMV